MKKVKLLLLLVTLTALLFLTKFMKNISKYIVYILIGIAGLAIGFAATKLFSKCKAEQVFVPGEIVLKDTCINRLPIVTVETQDTFVQTEAIKPGKKQTIKEKPALTEVNYSPKDSVFTTSFKKSYNWGLVQLDLEFDVEATSSAKLSDFEVNYQLDTAILNNVYTRTQTIILKDSADESARIVYLPVESTKKQTWVGLGASFKYDDKAISDFGLFVERHKTSVGLFVDPTQGFDKFGSYRLQVGQRLIRVSKN